MFYAKSKPTESMEQHTNNLLNRMKILKNAYGDEILKGKQIDKEMFWKTLELACMYHDFGKVYTPFQNLILKKLGTEQIKTKLSYENVKHEQLSPMFIPLSTTNIDKEYKNILIQAIYYHHERYDLDPDKKYVDEIIKNDILLNLDEIKNQLHYDISDELNSRYLANVGRLNKIEEFIGKNRKLYLKYVLIKGLLNRLDHSASAECEIEDITSSKISDDTENYLKSLKYDLNDIQKFCLKNNDKNILVIGSTGIGKTEAALMWAQNSKCFFTLPLIVSINAIFDRIKYNIGYKNVGLLHSTAYEYIESKGLDDESTDFIYNQSKNFAAKFTVCTIDQIFTFVFKYKGYEKIYATLAYSKVIIDEIQAYSPHIVAVILKGIEMISKIGGQFMIMTATLPTIYKDYLNDKGIEFEEDKFLKNINRHRVKCMDREIVDDIDEICKNGINSKVLVIVNTVNKAIKFYKMIKQKNNNVNLLHARFIQEDKANLENKIKEFSNSDNSGIWITTQIVEASLDISFDFLYTELSILDSLFQRMGRCYRSKEYTGKLPNVLVYSKNVSGVGEKNVYDKDIHNKSLELISKYDGQYMTEEEKVNLVEKLYLKSNIENTNFYTEFNKSMHILNYIEESEITRSQANEILREIESIKVIPRQIYDEKFELFDKYRHEKDYKRKSEIKRDIERLTVNIRKNSVRKDFNNIIHEIANIDDIFVTDLDYDRNIGLILKKNEILDIDKRLY